MKLSWKRRPGNMGRHRNHRELENHKTHRSKRHGVRVVLSLAIALFVAAGPSAVFADSEALVVPEAQPTFELITRVEAEYLRLEDLTRIPGLTLTPHSTWDLKTVKLGEQQFFVTPSEDGRLNVLDTAGRETWHSAFREAGVDYVEKGFLETLGQSALLEPANEADADDGALEAQAEAAPEADIASEAGVIEVETVEMGVAEALEASLRSEQAAPLLASAEEGLQMVPAVPDSPADIPVLCYHHLLLEAEMTPFQKLNGAIVSVEKFESDMAYLKSRGVTTLTMAQLEDHLAGRWTAPENSVVITFDDGYKSVYRYAYPILKAHGFTATMFVVTGTVEAAPAAWDPAVTVKISWDEMNKAKNVFEYHPHSHNLHGLSESGVPLSLALDEISLKADLQIATGLLEERGFNRTRVYAHPYGAHDTRADLVLNSFGYVMAFALGEAPASAADVPYALKRYGVFPYTGQWSFDKMLQIQAEVTE
ncbi:polysaccharide deacetylase family protein [Acidaminobacter hydrogenoformans]|uniref:Polysaccharide deacetylase n=1 Tax=Acidaminobacter hydrogenoformans DSM 2784 TaxID=1120920 RepID=A0A1G5RZ48_9FIRM|nr:polysaccharide deacetylase family protein [Acidaminobacter hydrogenoformans]SCZ79030.1 Polysaccharide deacetylase [Acidaminobacter hydrogenoformans DSM 2784]